MSILGLFTNEGISKTINAQGNTGFKIYPESFSISRDTASLVVTRTAQNSGTWFTAPISGRTVVDHNTIKIICTIPPESALVVEDVKEVCVFAKDADGNDFLLALGQPTEEILYDPTGTVTLELQISLADVDLTSIYVFNNTKAVEIDAHATDPNAHPEVMAVLAKYGITVEGGAYAKERMGQPIEFPVEFEGTKSTFTHDGVVWTSKYNGNELNGVAVVFDGLKSNDDIRADFNAAHYPNTIEHDGVGSAVSVAGSKTLVGGTYSLAEKDIVYKDEDGVYKRAFADGSAKSRIAGIAYLAKKLVVGHGHVDINSGLPAGSPLYLSGTTAGKITNFNTNISIGVSLGDFIFFTGYAGDASASVSQEFDAVVTDAAGIGQFPTTQQAIDFVPNNGRILIRKQEIVKHTLDTKNKNLTIVANHADAGWKRFLGQPTKFKILFNDMPTRGTWRMEWEGQESNDIPFYGDDGVTNRILHSEDLAHAYWNRTALSGVIANAAIAHDGKLRANKIQEDGTDSLHTLGKSVAVISGKKYTYSLRAKKAQRSRVIIDLSDTTFGSGAYAVFDLDTGTIVSAPTVGNTKIMDEGDGWYRCFYTVIATSSAADGFSYGPTTAINDSTYLGVIGNGIYITDVMVNEGDAVSYLASNTINGVYPPAYIIVETEFNLFNGHNGVTVTGNYTNGFEVVFNDLQLYTLPTFNFAGLNEIQKFNFSDVPDNGTFRLEFEDDQTVNYAFNDNITQMNEIVNDLVSLQNVEVTGSFASGFTYEFKGGWLVDGNKEMPVLKAVTNFLHKNGVQIDINGESDALLPTDAIVIQKGKAPATNLYNDSTLVTIQAQFTQLGEEIGPDRLMDVDSPILKIEGMGLIEDFREGLVLKNANTILTLQARTLLVDKPILLANRLPTVNFDIEIPNYAKDVVAELRLTEHPTLPKRAMVSGIDLKLPSGITLVKSLDNLKAIFIGAEIDFSTGKVYDKNGTDIGIDFSVPVITPTMWKWFSVNMIVSGSDVALNIATANILVLPATGEGATKELAPQAPVDDYPIGLIALRGALGEKEKTLITTVKDHFTHRLAGKTFILHHPLESVAFYFDEPSLAGNPTALALTADRFVKMTTLVANDFQATVAQKIAAYIEADSRFTASVIGNKVTVENADLGSVPDADMGDTGFFGDIILKGTETDPTGIDDVNNANIMQFSTGSGSGAGGIGAGDIFISDLDFMLKDSYYGYMTPIAFQKDKEKKLSVIDGRYATTKKYWELDAGESITSFDMIDPSFKAELSDVDKVGVALKYNYLAVDPNPTVEVSRDGGSSYETLTMRFDSAGILYTDHKFAQPQLATVIKDYPVSNADGLTAINNTNLEISQEFLTHPTLIQTYQELTLYLNKLGPASGNLFVSIMKDDGTGNPSRNVADMLWQSDALSVGPMPAGNFSQILALPSLMLPANTKHHIVITSDYGYKLNSSFGGAEIAVRADTSSPTAALAKKWTGTYSNFTGSWTYSMKGIVLDVRVRITSSVNDSGIIGFGLFYGEENYPSTNLYRNIEIQHFDGALNLNTFTLTEFLPNPDFLEVTLTKTGQTWKWPAFQISGYNVIFPANTFNMAGSTLTLRFDQTKGGAYDNSDRNLSMIAENHLGSQNASLDKSAPGRGIFLRRPDGTLREICIDDSDNIVVYSV